MIHPFRLPRWKQLLVITLSPLLAWPGRACDTSSDTAEVLAPFEIKVSCNDTSYDGSCFWQLCSDGTVYLIGCDFPNPNIDIPLPPEPPSGSEGTDNPDECDPNKFTARDGNAYRQIADLRIAGAVAKGGLLWLRHHNTIPREGQEPFGLSGSWRHNWQYDLMEKTLPEYDRPVYILVSPTGIRRAFVPDAAGGWSTNLTFVETLEKTPDGFDVVTPEGGRLHFVRYPKANGTGGYRMETKTDAYGLQTRLAYNAQGLLTQVTEPGGRSLHLAYQDVSYETGRFDLRIGTFLTAPAAGQWIEFAVPAGLQGKAFQEFCLFGEKTGKLAVAEMQFFTAGNPNPLRGTPSGSGDRLAAAFDGDNLSGFVGRRDAGNVLAFKLDQAAIIDRVRILALAGQEESLQGAWLQAFRPVSAVRTVVSEVTGSDGSSVQYDYELKLYTPQIGPAAKTVELRGVRYADGTKASYRYELVGADRKPLLVEADDPRYDGKAKRIRYTYHDTLGMLHKEINPQTGGEYASLELDAKDPTKRTVTYSDLRQVSFVFSAKALGRPVERKDALGRITRYDYAENGTGLLSAETDHQGRRKEFTHDKRGRRLSSTAHGKRREQVRDAAGRVVKATDQHSRETVFTRDGNGRIARVEYPEGTAREYAYDALGRPTSVRDIDGRTHTITYDARGLKTAWNDPDGRTTSYAYDSRDRLAGITNPLGQKTAFEYNDRGLVTKVTGPDGATQQYTYDNYGRKIAQTDKQGRTTRFTHDELSRVIRQEDHAGRVTTFDYTELPQGCGSCTLTNQASRIVQPDGQVISNLYDGAGRLLARTVATNTPDSATTLYAYDNDNNLVSITDPTGAITRYTFDDEGHRLSATDPIGRVTQWTYDGHGNVVRITAPDGGVTRQTYDAQDRLLATTDAAGNTTRLAYDTFGNVTSVTDAAKQITKHTYEGKRRTATLYADGKRATWEYDAAGRVVRATTPDGVVTTTTYDAGNRVLRVGRVIPNAPSQAITNTYDTLGRRTSTTDFLGRTTRWTYDARGNVLTTVRPDGLQTANTYDAQDRVLTTSDAALQVTRFEYDTAGNQTALTDAKGNTYRFTYDALHRKTAMIYPDNSQERWTYDPAGRLVLPIFLWS